MYGIQPSLKIVEGRLIVGSLF